MNKRFLCYRNEESMNGILRHYVRMWMLHELFLSFFRGTYVFLSLVRQALKQ